VTTQLLNVPFVVVGVFLLIRCHRNSKEKELKGA